MSYFEQNSNLRTNWVCDGTTIDLARQRITRGSSYVYLTALECAVMSVLIKHYPSSITKKEIAYEVTRDALRIGSVQTHVCNIRRKFETLSPNGLSIMTNRDSYYFYPGSLI